jgi:hypothetical protein
MGEKTHRLVSVICSQSTFRAHCNRQAKRMVKEGNAGALLVPSHEFREAVKLCYQGLCDPSSLELCSLRW